MAGVRDLADRLKADPQSITTSVGSTRGGPSHMMLVQLAKLAGADPRKLKVVTFSGSAESITNILGGHIEVMSSSVDAVVPHHKSGTMRILGIATRERSPALPGVPTLRDQGYDVVMGNWTAIMGPKGLTPAQIAFWEELLERTFNHPAWKSMLEAEALEADFRNSQALRELRQPRLVACGQVYRRASFSGQCFSDRRTDTPGCTGHERRVTRKSEIHLAVGFSCLSAGSGSSASAPTGRARSASACPDLPASRHAAPCPWRAPWR